MKRTRYSEGQIIGILTEHAICAKCADLCREHGPSEGTFYAWKAKYGGMTVSDAKRLKSPEDENAKLTKLLAEQMLDSETFACHWSEDNGRAQRRNYSQKMAASAAKREAVAHLQAKLGLSEQRACRLVDVDREMIRYQPIRPAETELCQRLQDLATERSELERHWSESQWRWFG